MDSYRVVPINAVSAVTVDGDLDLESSRQLISGLARDAAHKDLLLDFRSVPTSFTYRDIYKVVLLISEQGAWSENRLAVLDDYDVEFEKTQFMEAAAQETGLQMRAFVDHDAAVAWLEAWASRHGE